MGMALIPGSRLGVYEITVDQTRASWNPISVWLRRIGTLRPAA